MEGKTMTNKDLDIDFDFDFEFELKDENTSAQGLFDEDSSDFYVKEEHVMCYSNKGSHKRNEDNFDFIKGDSYIMAGVYDGHGGSTVSLYLKNKLLRSIVEHEKFQIDPCLAIKDRLQKIQKEVTLQFDENCGSTVLIVFWKKDEIIVVSLGDGCCYGYESRLSETRTDLNIAQTKNMGKNQKDNFHKTLLNEVHDLDNEDERKRVRSLGGSLFKIRNSYRVNGELNISRSIGDSKYKKWISSTPSIRRYQAKFEFVLLATDGFSKMLSGITASSEVESMIENVPYFKDNATLVMISKPMVFN